MPTVISGLFPRSARSRIARADDHRRAHHALRRIFVAGQPAGRVGELETAVRRRHEVRRIVDLGAGVVVDHLLLAVAGKGALEHVAVHRVAGVLGASAAFLRYAPGGSWNQVIVQRLNGGRNGQCPG
jgi:hypothetical protein